MWQAPGVLPGKWPVLAAVAAGTGFAALLAATAAVYAAVDWLGSLMIATFLLLSTGLAVSGWLYHWRAAEAAKADVIEQQTEGPVLPGGQDSAALRLLEAVAGQVKNSATTIRGFSDVIGDSAETEFREPVRYLRENSWQLSAFAAQLHDYVRFERGRLRLKEQQVDAAELVEAALGLCRTRAEAAQSTIVAHLPENVEARCDAERICAALASLVTWAVAASRPGTLLDVTVSRLPDDGLAIDIKAMPDDQASAPDGSRLFEPQLAQNGLNGFALPIARRVALLHSGDVTVDCATGAGAVARLTLPADRVTWPGAEHKRARAA